MDNDDHRGINRGSPKALRNFCVGVLSEEEDMDQIIFYNRTTATHKSD